MNSVCDYTAISLVNLGVPAPHQLILCKPAKKMEDDSTEARAARQARLAEQLRAGLRRAGRKARSGSPRP